MIIPDPIERMDARIERQMDKIVGDKIPCCGCGKLTPFSDCHPWGPMPDAPPVCGKCLDKLIKEA